MLHSTQVYAETASKTASKDIVQDLCPVEYEGILCEKPLNTSKNPISQLLELKKLEIPKIKQVSKAKIASSQPAPKKLVSSPVPQDSLIHEATGSAGLNADVLFELVNNYRDSIQLPRFEKEERVCKLAQERTPELYNEIFVNGNMHAGLYNRNLPYWITENMIHLQTEEGALNWWLNSSVHRNSIQGNYKYSCVACEGNSCSQLFTSFDPKVTPIATQSARLEVASSL